MYAPCVPEQSAVYEGNVKTWGIIITMDVMRQKLTFIVCFFRTMRMIRVLYGLPVLCYMFSQGSVEPRKGLDSAAPRYVK